MWLETEIFTTNFGRKDLRKHGESTYQVELNGEEKPLSNGDFAVRTAKKQNNNLGSWQNQTTMKST